MPKYVYKCPQCGKEADVVHGPGEAVTVFCPEGDRVLMRRKFVMPGVNWSGMPPSKGEVHPKIKAELENGYRRRRDRGA
jgi:putative FmdB family regulatory protein